MSVILIRVVALAALVAIGVSVLAWLLTGNARYRQVAWNVGLGALFVLAAVMMIFVVERLVGPLG